MKQTSRIAHLTSAHPRFDTRIFLKECRSLAAAGHEVSLIVADGKGDAERDGVRILDVGASRGRLDRMMGATRRVLARALSVDAEVYHIHDPELLYAALALKRRGRRVIFDAHEDLPRQILSKPYLHPVVRGSVAATAAHVQRFACRRLDAVVAATPSIHDAFVAMGVPTVEVSNYPLLDELRLEAPWSEKQKEIAYVGGISQIRGIREAIAAMAVSRSGATLNLAGTFEKPGLKAELEHTPGWAKVNELGFLSRSEVRRVLGRSVAGLVTFKPVPNHIEAQPNKMFEYMSAGLPVIASAFPRWSEIIEGHACGLCVDPLDPHAIAAAIDHLVENLDVARRMGENGRRIVETRYNWAVEEKKLLSLYDRVLGHA